MVDVKLMPTSLGEEGAETMIRVSGLALLGQVTIGLHSVNASVHITHIDNGAQQDIPGYRARGSKATMRSRSVIRGSIKLANPSGAAGVHC